VKQKLKRILLDSDIAMHAEIKARAAFKGISMKAYILRAVAEQIKKDSQYE
jgi:hypothetical protein